MVYSYSREMAKNRSPGDKAKNLNSVIFTRQKYNWTQRLKPNYADELLYNFMTKLLLLTSFENNVILFLELNIFCKYVLQIICMFYYEYISKSENGLVADVLRLISDKKSLELFRIVVLTNSQPDAAADVLISKTKFSRKQYYFRMSKLTKAGLIKRKNGIHNGDYSFSEIRESQRLLS